MKTIFKIQLLLVSFVLSLAANATASEFAYKPASPTVAAVDLQRVEGGHIERFQKPFEIQRLSENVYWVSVQISTPARWIDKLAGVDIWTDTHVRTALIYVRWDD